MYRYTRTSENTQPQPIGNVGWWLLSLDDTINTLKGDRYQVGGYIMYDGFVPTIGKRSGVVIYDIRSQVYEIICQPEIASDDKLIKIITDAFDISDLRYDVISCDGHYRLPVPVGISVKELVDFGD